MSGGPARSADVVVIGGGIVGCATAYHLAGRGARVVLLEKGRVAHEQSSRNMGAVRQQARDPVETPLMVECVALWRRLTEELEADVEWIQGGNLGLAATPEELARFHAAVTVAHRFGVETRVVGPDDLRSIVPRLSSRWLGGLFTASDGHASPPKATLAFARAAQRRGVVLDEYCAVEGFEVAGGRVAAVRTERGRVAAGTFVCAAGAHSATLGRMLGLSVPVRVVRSTVAETVPLPELMQCHLWGDGFVMRQTRSGTVHLNFHSSRAGEYDVTLDSFRHLRLFLPVFLRNRTLLRVHVGSALARDVVRRLPGAEARRHPFKHTVDVEPLVNPTTVERCRAAFSRNFASLGEVRVQRTWAGVIDCTPDLLPVLGPPPALDNFLFATGFSGHGFAMAPLMGKVMADWALDGKAPRDLRPMRYSRFAEGDLHVPENLI